MSSSRETTRPASLEGALDGLLESFEADDGQAHSTEAQMAVHLTRLLQERASDLQTPQEKKQQTELERMMQSPRDKATLMQLTDQAFRSKNPHRAVSQLTHILDVQGVPYVRRSRRFQAWQDFHGRVLVQLLIGCSQRVNSKW